MATYRIYIQETSSRLLYTDVQAESKEAADALATAALDDGTWTEWAETQSDASLEHMDEMTAERKADGTLLKPEYDGTHVENHCGECGEFDSECTCAEDDAKAVGNGR